MLYKSVILISAALLLFGGCKKDEDPVSPPSNAFAGTWRVVFAGSYTGGGDATIDSQGKFALTAILVGQSGTFTNTITGTVTNSGSLSGDIYYSGSKVGTVSGTFSGNAASGSYQTSQPSSGTWSATRK